MATNDFIGFASSGNANIMSQADYAAAAEQSSGVQPGMASSKLANKVWRQGANMAAVIGELIKNHGINALDNGDLTTLYNALLSATASTTLAGLMSAEDKTKLDGLISTNATQTAAGYMSGADKTKLDGLISTNATPTAAGYMSASDKTLVDSIPELGTFNKMFFSQASGNYIAPRSGVYRITLKGGGGGGGGTNTTQYRLGAGGGEGGELVFYATLTKDQSYPYVIGAGGTAGTDSDSSPTNGGDGGATSFNSDYSVAGGNGGNFGGRTQTGYGGAGGSTYNAPTGTPVYFKPGIVGQSNIYGDQSNNKWLQYGCSGGGRGGSSQQSAPGIYGGGGRGTFEMGYGGIFYPPTVGGDGYILIEYAG